MLDEILKQTRQELGLTQKQLGKLLGISANTIARYERGEMQAQHPQVLSMAVDFLRLQMTPDLQKKVELLALSKEEFAATI